MKKYTAQFEKEFELPKQIQKEFQGSVDFDEFIAPPEPKLNDAHKVLMNAVPTARGNLNVTAGKYEEYMFSVFGMIEKLGKTPQQACKDLKLTKKQTDTMLEREDLKERCAMLFNNYIGAKGLSTEKIKSVLALLLAKSEEELDSENSKEATETILKVAKLILPSGTQNITTNIANQQNVATSFDVRSNAVKFVYKTGDTVTSAGRNSSSPLPLEVGDEE